MANTREPVLQPIPIMSLHPTHGQIHMFSEDVTKVKPQKRAQMRRRIGISAMSPTTRGGRLPVRARATASRTRPTWSPLGSNTPRPARRAT